jgi:uncharacterized protein YdiU (UPF0061 family)
MFAVAHHLCVTSIVSDKIMNPLIRGLTEGRAQSTKLRENLPGDSTGDTSQRNLFGVLWSAQRPDPDPVIALLGYSVSAATLFLGGSRMYHTAVGRGTDDALLQDALAVLSGHAPPPLAVATDGAPASFATVYTGFQFGVLPGQLGDGRCVTIAELCNRQNGLMYELQLKGGGKTPFSRFADGRLTLSAAIKEYVVSEVLGRWGVVPTTRALCVLATDRKLHREKSPVLLHAGMIVRLLPSSLRIGTFECLFYTQKHELLRELVDFTIRTFFSHVATGVRSNDADQVKAWRADGVYFRDLNVEPPIACYGLFLAEACANIGHMVASWQAAGFYHGVMNTDNISIHGVTLDYGPCDFIDKRFDEGLCTNPDDVERIYAFNEQRARGYCLALSPLFQVTGTATPESKAAVKGVFMAAVRHYYTAYDREYARIMALKLHVPQTVSADKVTALAVGLRGILTQGAFADSVTYHMVFAEIHRAGGVTAAASALRAQAARPVPLQQLVHEWIVQWSEMAQDHTWCAAPESITDDTTAGWWPPYVPTTHVINNIVAAVLGTLNQENLPNSPTVQRTVDEAVDAFVAVAGGRHTDAEAAARLIEAYRSSDSAGDGCGCG